MTYEYLCGACGHRWEAEQRISEDPLTDCPSCGKAEAKRQISGGGGFILKGGGWYNDLYSSAAKPKPEVSAGEATSATDSGSAKVAADSAQAPSPKKAEVSPTPTKTASAGTSSTKSSSAD